MVGLRLSPLTLTVVEWCSSRSRIAVAMVTMEDLLLRLDDLWLS